MTSGGFVRAGERAVFSGRFDVVDYDVTTPTGAHITRQVVRHPGAVTLVAHEAGELLFVQQYRAAVDAVLLELPAGKLDPGEDPETCARRELVEETGMWPAQLTHLSTFLVSPGWSDEVMWVYLAEDLRPRESNPQGAEEAHMTVMRIRVEDASAMVGDGTIRDAKSMIGVLLAAPKIMPI